MSYRKKHLFWLHFTINMLLFAMIASGCGGDKSTPTNNTPNPPPVVSIAISPTTASIDAGQSIKLIVTTQNTGVNWPSAASIAGSFTRSGNEVTWTPPAVAGAYSFTVTATADTSKTATATITVLTTPPAGSVSISISPTTASMNVGETRTLTVTRTNTNDFSLSVSPSTGHGCIKSGSNAVVCAPTAANTYTLTVTATADTSKTATAKITVYAPSDAPIDTMYFGINDSGLIAGAGIFSDGTVRAFVKNGDALNIFDYPDAIDYTYAIDVNDSEIILGYYINGYFLKIGNNYEDIGDYPGPYVTDFTGINNGGQLSGYITDSSGHVTGFIKTGGSFETIMHPSASFAAAACNSGYPCGTRIMGINNAGHVAGDYTDSAGVNRGFLYDGAVFTPIDHPDNSPSNKIYTTLSGINDNGEAVGYFWKAAESGNPGHGFVYDGSYEIFDHPGAAAGGEGTYILGINNTGRFVGWFDDGEKAVGFTGDL